MAQSSSTVATPGVVNKHNSGRKAGLVLPAGVKGVILGRVFTNNGAQVYLEGAQVRIKGTTISTVTNSKGIYSLDITTLFDSQDEITVVCESKDYSLVERTIKNPLPRETQLRIEMISKDK